MNARHSLSDAQQHAIKQLFGQQLAEIDELSRYFRVPEHAIAEIVGDKTTPNVAMTENSYPTAKTAERLGNSILLSLRQEPKQNSRTLQQNLCAYFSRRNRRG